MTTLRAGSSSDVGRVRSVNEDRAFAGGTLFAVADGMGGHAGGEVASSTAIEVLREAFGLDPSEAGLSDAVRRANLAVWDRSRAEPDLRGMGTTLTAAALVGEPGSEHLAIVNVGDSRAYLHHTGELRQLTYDHSLVEEMVRSGELSAEEAAVHPQRHIVTRALGAQPVVEVDAWRVVPEAGDRVLLCSDGLVNEVGDSEITSVLERQPDPQIAADELVRLARAHGGNDNITVVVIDVVDLSGGSPGALQGEVPPGGAQAPRAEGVSSAAAPDASGDGSEIARRPPGSGDGVTGMIRAVSPAGDGGPDPDVSQPGTGVATRLESRPAEGEAAPLPPAEGEAPRRPPRPRRMTVRVVIFVLILIAVLIGAALVVRWFADNSYYVGLDGNQIAIYQGRPGGILWFRPHISEQTGLTTASVLPSRLGDLRQGMQEPSLDAARRYIANLTAEARSLPATTPTSTRATGPAGAQAVPGTTAT